MTLEEKAVNFDTAQHIAQVRNNLNLVVTALLLRGERHDLSKLEPPEVSLFTQHTARLADLEYGSDAYKEALKDLGPALQHHYAKNRHHPEHWPEGIKNMDIVDVVEMFCDWAAAVKRHNTGNLRKSIAHNAERFDMPETLRRILENSVGLFE